MNEFRFFTSEWLAGGLHLVIVVVTLHTVSAEAWPFSLAAMSVVSFVAWIVSYRRYRTTADLPTSNVASAAQGYVELFGRSAQTGESSLRSKLSGTPCCWYRFYIEEKTSHDKWSLVDSGISTDPFLLVDATGRCIVDPDGAEVICTQKKTWTQGTHRYTEWLLAPDSQLYAIGQFTTGGGASAVADDKGGIRALLSSWKENRPALLQRFDLDGNGDIDMREWELARLQAAREVRRHHAEIRMGEPSHTLSKPADGRLFLLACDLPEKIGRRFRLWSWAHLAVFFVAGIASFTLFSL
jgi:hypothetical protein